MNYLFLTTNFALKLRGNVENVVTFTVHLSVTKSRFGRHSCPPTWRPITKSYYFVSSQISGVK